MEKKPWLKKRRVTLPSDFSSLSLDQCLKCTVGKLLWTDKLLIKTMNVKLKTFFNSKNSKLLLTHQIWYDIKQNKAEDQEREEYGLSEIALARSWFKDSCKLITTLKTILWSVRCGLRGGTRKPQGTKFIINHRSQKGSQSLPTGRIMKKHQVLVKWQKDRSKRKIWARIFSGLLQEGQGRTEQAVSVWLVWIIPWASRLCRWSPVASFWAWQAWRG